MRHIFLQDQKIRLQFKNFEIHQKIIKALVFNATLPAEVRRKLSWQLAKVGLLSSFVFVKNYCTVSGRSSAVYSFFNLSRLVIKKFYALKHIPNLSKSS